MNQSTKEGVGGRGHRQEVGVASELRRTNLWKEVGAGEERPFDFSQQSKRRHQVHQVEPSSCVCVCVCAPGTESLHRVCVCVCVHQVLRAFIVCVCVCVCVCTRY